MSSSLAIRRFSAASAAAAVATTIPSTISSSRAKSQLQSVYDPDKALEIYSSISPDYPSPTSTRYPMDYTVRRLAKSHRLSDIETFLESHKTNPKITQEPFLCSLVRSYGIAGMFDHALKTYDQMDDSGTPRTIASFNTLLSAGVASKNFERVAEVFDEIPKRHQLVPDKISYGILVKAYCEMGSPELAMERLKEMQEKGVEITVVTFTSIIHSLYEKGKDEEAEGVWSEMVKSGCSPDVGAYNVKIRRVQGEEPKGVEGLIEEMRKAGLKPDTITYNYLMTCYFMNGMIDEALTVYKELKGNGCKPNAATFRTLVFHLCKKERFEAAHELFEQSVKVNKIPDFNTLKHLVEGLAKNSRSELAEGLILTAKKRFPTNVVKAWAKLENDLGLGSNGTYEADSK